MLAWTLSDSSPLTTDRTECLAVQQARKNWFIRLYRGGSFILATVMQLLSSLGCCVIDRSYFQMFGLMSS